MASEGPPTERSATDAGDLTGVHVLVVEDSPTARSMLVRLLKALGCTSDEAEDGRVAVEKVNATLLAEALSGKASGARKEGSGLATSGGVDGGAVDATTQSPVHRMYDLILMDSVMPIMDGPSATKAIRALGFTRPILGVTGNTLPEQVDDFLAHGADEVVGKPVRHQVLKAAIRHHLERTREAQQAVEGDDNIHVF